MKKFFSLHTGTFIILIIITACMQYFLSNPIAKVDVTAFEAACGIGVSVTPEQVEQAVSTPEQIHAPNVISVFYPLLLDFDDYNARKEYTETFHSHKITVGLTT